MKSKPCFQEISGFNDRWLIAAGLDNTLEELETLLDPRDYFRISRGLTVRLNSIQKIHPHLNGRLKLELAPPAPEEIFVSRERAGEFKVWLGG